MQKLFYALIITFSLIFNGFTQSDTRYDTDKNLPFNEKAGDVNPQTGNLTLQYTDVALPGRAGLDFSFGRIWSLNQANVFHMYQDQNSQDNRLSCDTIEQTNKLGVGWSSSLPYILTDTRSGTLQKNLFFNGNVYAINYTENSFKEGYTGNESYSNLIGYDLLDLRIYQASDLSYGGYAEGIPSGYNLSDQVSDICAYQLVLKDNSRFYFRPDGKLMLQIDKSGLNRIWYFYGTDPVSNKSRLKLVVDTVGRKIEFLYNPAGNISRIEWKVTKGSKNGEIRGFAEETRFVEYHYTDLSAFPLIKQVKNLVLAPDRKDSYLLQGVTDSLNASNEYLSYYTYQEGIAHFSYNTNLSHYQNVYLMITANYQFYQTGTSRYKSARYFEYAVPAKGLYRKYFYNGFMENYRVSRAYARDKNGRLMYDTAYLYYEEGSSGDATQYSTVIKKGNVKSRYYYLNSSIKTLQHVLEKIVTETSDGFLESREFSYDENRTKVQEDVYRQGKWVYREQFNYDRKGNLRRYTDKNGLIVYKEYHEKFAVPTLEEKTVTVNGVKKQYRVEYDINNSTGLVEKTHVYYTGKADPLTDQTPSILQAATAYAYDQYGNMISTTNAQGQTTHTLYDAATHAYPVKVWQDVNIASWSQGGNVHTNWQNSPDGSKTVRIRSWKVFNSDGTVWLEIDNEGYALEHYYDPRGQEIETVNPGLDDIIAFARPIVIDENGNPVSSELDINDFLSDYLNSPAETNFITYFDKRSNNAGTRMFIDYASEVIRTETDIDKAINAVKITEKEADGLGNMIKEIEYAAGEEKYYKEMTYDDQGRMIALTDADRGEQKGQKTLHGTSFVCYASTWQIEYDDLGRKKRVIYPETQPGKIDIKTLTYDDYINSVLTLDPEGRSVLEKHDWNGNLVQMVQYGDSTTPKTASQTYSFVYDELNRKIKFTDAMGLITTYDYDERSFLTRQGYLENNGAGAADLNNYDRMDYNVLGQLVKKIDRKGQVITFVYDQLGRNIESLHYKSRNDFENQVLEYRVHMTYDNRGNAVRIENNNLIEHYIYDFANRVISLERKLKDAGVRQALAEEVWPGDENSQIFSFNYHYNDAGMVTEMIYPDGSTHHFEYDEVLARLKKIKDGDEDFVKSLEYNKSGVVTRMNYANTIFQSWAFDNRKRISHLQVGNTEDGSVIADMRYRLNSNGDILSINDNEYSYDGFNRIISAKTLIPGEKDLQKLVQQHFGTYAGGEPIVIEGQTREYNEQADIYPAGAPDGVINGFDDVTASLVNDEDIYDIESFEYDKNGNRTQLVQNGDIYTYEYGKRNRLNKIYKQTKESTGKKLFTQYSYDNNGNTVNRKIYQTDGVTVKSEIIFNYDTMNRLVKSVETISGQPQAVNEYFYDNAGNRFIKKNEKGTTLYLRHGQIAVAMDIELDYEDASDDATSDVIGTINRYVLSGDLLAGRISKVFIKNLTDNLVTSKIEKYWYHLDHLNSTKCVTKSDGSLDVMYEYRAFGEQLKKLGNGEAKYTYGGKELDLATNLYYFNARYYDATTGRFINVDPVQDGTNWYVYCNNNPLSFKDPTGLAPRNLTETQRNLYKNWVQSVTPAGVSNTYDCADTAAYIFQQAYNSATGQTPSLNTTNGTTTNPVNIYTGHLFGANQTNINYYKTDGTQTYDTSDANIDRNFNSDNIEVGTVGLYRKTTNDPNHNFWSGHTVTITGIERDDNGNVTSITTLEGHTQGQEQTVGQYSSFQEMQDNTVGTNGEFVGWGEWEPQQTE